MKKDGFDIVEMSFSKDEIQDVVGMHHKIFSGHILDGRLIYFDVNFKNFLENIRTDKSNTFYLLKRGASNVGFIHYKIINNIVFVNNLYVDTFVQGKGLGKFLFRETLGQFIGKGYTEVMLDVFVSNVTAYTWYKKLGFQEQEKYIWYSVLGLGDKNDSKLDQKVDTNGFLGLYHQEKKIGTIVNQGTLILHHLDYLSNEINRFFILFRAHQQECYLLNKLFRKIVIVEESVRLKGLVESVYKNL